MADNRKINHEKGMIGAAAQAFPFLNENGAVKGGAMDKRRAIQIMTKASDLYHNNLEDQKILFLYGIPSEVKNNFRQRGRCCLRSKATKWCSTVIIFCI